MTSSNHTEQNPITNPECKAEGYSSRAVRTYLVISAVSAAIACNPSDENEAADAAPSTQPGASIDPDAELPVPTGASIDVHTHLASQTLVDLMTGGGIPAAGAKDLVSRLDEANVEHAVVLSAGYFALPDNSNMAAENDWVASQVAKYPARLVGFCGINPLYENAASEVDRCLEEPSMIGVKLHMDGSTIDMTRSDHVNAVAAVFDRIEAHDAPVLMHVSDVYGQPLTGPGFANLSEIIAAHPTTRITHAHCAGNTDDQSIEMWLRLQDSGYRENAFVDISACLAFYSHAPLATRELLVWRLRTWGIERVLLGSDYFQYGEDETPQETLETLARYPFSEEELDTIVNNDASAWLGQNPW